METVGTVGSVASRDVGKRDICIKKKRVDKSIMKRVSQSVGRSVGSLVFRNKKVMMLISLTVDNHSWTKLLNEIFFTPKHHRYLSND